MGACGDFLLFSLSKLSVLVPFFALQVYIEIDFCFPEWIRFVREICAALVVASRGKENLRRVITGNLTPNLHH